MKISQTPASWSITFAMDDGSTTAPCTINFRKHAAPNAPRLTPMEVLIGELCSHVLNVENAFTDVLDGNSAWYDIQPQTGLSEDRCKEISALFSAITSGHR